MNDVKGRVQYSVFTQTSDRELSVGRLIETSHNMIFAHPNTDRKLSSLVDGHSSMGKVQKKTGKGRLDKYYKLAKCVLYLHLMFGLLK